MRGAWHDAADRTADLEQMLKLPAEVLRRALTAHGLPRAGAKPVLALLLIDHGLLADLVADDYTDDTL